MSVKRTKLITGSLRDPIFRFIVSANIVHNPHLSKDTKHFYDRFIQIAQKYDKKKIQETYT